MDRKRTIILLVLLAIAILASFVIELTNTAKPCKLCYYQRYIYIGLAIVATVRLFIKQRGMVNKIFNILTYGLIIGQIGLSGFQTGLEHRWWNIEMSCTTKLEQDFSFEQFELYIEQQSIESCSTPSFVFFHLSLTEWNLIYSTLILLFLLLFRNQNTVLLKNGSN